MENIWTYQHKTKAVFGPGALSRLPRELEPFGADRVLVVSGRKAMRASGVLDRLAELLGRNRAVLFDRVPPNPPLSVIEECAATAKTEKCGAVVAIGGGSPLDAGKAAALLVTNDGSALDFFNRSKNFDRPGLPVIAIPTTSGTGSEVGPFMVATDTERELKLSCGPLTAYPAVAIMDPELTLSLPKDQTAATGLDALSHCFECYWAKHSQPVSDNLALEAIALIFKWLPAAVADGGNLDARENMMYASMAAGFAFGSTGTCACHSISYPLTVKWGVDHGFACAFTLAEILDWNWDSLGAARQQRLLYAMGTENQAHAVSKLRDFCIAMGTPKTLSAMGIKPEDIQTFPAYLNRFNLANNAAPISDEEIIAILKNKL